MESVMPFVILIALCYLAWQAHRTYWPEPSRIVTSIVRGLGQLARSRRRPGGGCGGCLAVFVLLHVVLFVALVMIGAVAR